VTHKLLMGAIFIGLPFVLWLGLWLIASYSDINMRRVVPVIRALRWLAYLTTLGLFVMHFVFEHFPSVYAFCSLGFSSGVILIDSWAIRRFAPERLSAFETRFGSSTPKW